MPRQTQSVPLLDILRDGPAWLGPVLAVKAFAIVGIVLPLVLGIALGQGGRYFGLALPGGAFLGIVILVASGLGRMQRVNEKRTLDGVHTIDDVHALGWQQFEALLGEAFRREGYAVRRKDGGGPDGGVDVRLARDGKATLVQCKHWKGRAGAPIVRELLGVVAIERAHAGIVVASGGFTKEAIGFADQASRQGQQLRLIDGDEFLRMIKAVQPSQGQTEPNSVPLPPTCPKCGATMERKLARRGVNAGNAFWSCTRYPACKGSRNIE